MDKYFDKIFVINLDERKDRWEHALQEFKKYNITNFERFSAIKPTELPDPKFTNGFVLQTERYIKGAWGCRSSHISIIKIAKERGYKNVLILEDDFTITENRYNNLDISMKELNDLKIEWDILYLGITPIYQNMNLVGKYLYKIVGKCHGCHSYAVNSSFYDTLIEKHNTSNVEIDNICAKDIQINNRCYGIKPMIIFQYSDHSDIRGHNVNYSNKIK